MDCTYFHDEQNRRVEERVISNKHAESVSETESMELFVNLDKDFWNIESCRDCYISKSVWVAKGSIYWNKDNFSEKLCPCNSDWYSFELKKHIIWMERNTVLLRWENYGDITVWGTLNIDLVLTTLASTLIPGFE